MRISSNSINSSYNSRERNYSNSNSNNNYSSNSKNSISVNKSYKHNKSC